MDALVEVSFRLTGSSLPFDHGYALYGALSRIVPDLHGMARLALTWVRGQRVGDGSMLLPPDARLRLRVEPDKIATLLPFAGKALMVGGTHRVRIGVPEIRPLSAASVLQARFVTIKKFDGDPEAFGAAVRRQLDALGVRGRVQVGARRAVRIAGVRIVGFGVTIFDLSDEESMKVLEAGVGGRRRMGCGVFEGLGVEAARRARAGVVSASAVSATPSTQDR